ncbi:HAD family hydrolase [Candidatus Bathyarchaeota archaeon]|nr:HAD family hydrolase [Candidatus Bathyarchaeota archaeon]
MYKNSERQPEYCFDVVVTSVDMGCEKPDEKIFLEALGALDVGPAEAVMVGDRISKDSQSQQAGHEDDSVQMEQQVS